MAPNRFDIVVMIQIMLAAAVTMASWIDDRSWQEYKLKWHKNYSVCTEEATRYMLFLINTHNSTDSSGSTKSDKFSDLFLEERQKMDLSETPRRHNHGGSRHRRGKHPRVQKKGHNSKDKCDLRECSVMKPATYKHVRSLPKQIRRSISRYLRKKHGKHLGSGLNVYWRCENDCCTTVRDFNRALFEVLLTDNYPKAECWALNGYRGQ